MAEAFRHLALINNLSALSPLSQEDIGVIESLQVKARKYTRSTKIDAAYAPSMAGYFVVSGWAYVREVMVNGKQQVHRILMSGDFVDNRWSLNSIDPQSVVAIDDCVIASITDTALQRLLSRPAIEIAVYRSTQIEVQMSRAAVMNIARKDARSRIASFICELSDRLTRAEGFRSAVITCPLTQETLADSVGLTSVHANRIVKQLREAGVLTIRKGAITIHDWEELRRIGHYDGAYLGLPDASGGSLIHHSQRHGDADATQMQHARI